MEKHHIAKVRAERYLKIADHMLTQTYPLLRDPKLLLAVMENVFLSMRYSMEALLYYDRLYKNIPAFQENFESKFNMFRQRLLQRHAMAAEYATTMQNVREMIMEHKRSPVEFSRGGSFVICNDSFSMKTVNAEQMGRVVGVAKSFFNYVNSRVS